MLDWSTRSHVVMAAVLGRRQVCRQCGHDDHWTFNCLNRKLQRSTTNASSTHSKETEETSPTLNQDTCIWKQKNPKMKTKQKTRERRSKLSQSREKKKKLIPNTDRKHT